MSGSAASAVKGSDDPVDQFDDVAIEAVVVALVEPSEEAGQEHDGPGRRLRGAAMQPRPGFEGPVPPVRDVQLRKLRHGERRGCQVTAGDLVPLHCGGEVLQQQQEVLGVVVEVHMEGPRCSDVEVGCQLPVERRLGPVVAEGDTDAAALQVVGRALRHHRGRQIRFHSVGQDQSETRRHLTGSDRSDLGLDDGHAQRGRERLRCQSLSRRHVRGRHDPPGRHHPDARRTRNRPCLRSTVRATGVESSTVQRSP